MKKQKVTFENRSSRLRKEKQQPPFEEFFNVLPKGQDQAQEYRLRALALNWRILKVEIVSINQK